MDDARRPDVPRPDPARSDAASPDPAGRDAAGPHCGPLLRALWVASLIVLVVGGLAGAALLLLPTGWIVNRANVQVWIAVTTPLGLREAVTPEQFGAVMNVLLFIPVFAALAVLRPLRRWVLVGFALSAAVEVYQLILGTREADPIDVLANTLGAAIGVVIGLALHRAARALDARRDARRESLGTDRGTARGSSADAAVAVGDDPDARGVSAPAAPRALRAPAGPAAGTPAGGARRGSTARAARGAGPRASASSRAGGPDDRD